MYVGHVAVALAAKGVRPTIPLWFLIVAAQAPDWLVIATRLSGHEIARVERVTETSLSFVVVAIPLALAFYAGSKDVRSSALVWLVVASHAMCDFFTSTHTLLPGGIAQGLGWYRRPLHDFAIETAMIVAAAFMYRRSLPDRAKRSGIFMLMFSALVLFQAAVDVYLSSLRRGGRLADEIHSGRLFH